MEAIMAEQKYRIGIGYDIHRLTENRDLIIGGVLGWFAYKFVNNK